MAKGFAVVLRLFLVAILALPASRTVAAEPDPKAESRARFTAGQSHYNLNEFNEALVEFKEAYRIFPDAVFLYNLGQCERQLNHYEEAIRFYRSFLRNQPKAPNRLDVQRKIEEMESALKNRPPEQMGEPSAPPPTTGSEKTEVTLTKTDAPVPGETANTPPPKPAEPPLPPIPDQTADEAIPQQPAGVANLEQAAPPAEVSPAFYRTWWFWTATGVVMAGAATAVVLSRASTSGPPETTLGGKKVF